jgi:hypothetical protein
MTADRNYYFIGKGVCKCQLLRQPDDSWQKGLLCKKGCVKVSYQDSLMTAGKNDYFKGKGVCKCQLSRQPDDSRQKLLLYMKKCV